MSDSEWVSDPSFQQDDEWTSDPSFKPDPKSSNLTTGVRNFVQGATGSLSDEIAGGVEAVGRAAGLDGLGASPIKDVSVSDDGPTLDWEIIKDAYKRARDKEREALKKDAKDSPVLSGVAQLGGGLMSPVNKIMPNASLAKSGAAIGAVNSFGASDADNLQDLAVDTAGGTILGGVLGKTVDVASPYVGKAVDKAKTFVGENAKDLAEQMAFKSSGAMLKDFRAENGRGRINDIGRHMLDNKTVSAFDSVDDVAAKALQAKSDAGDKLDDIYNQASKVYKEKMLDVGFNPARDKESVLASAKAELGDTVGAGSALQRLSDYLDEIAVNNTMPLNLRRTNDIKGALDEQINYSRNPLTKEPAVEKAFYGGRKELQNIVDDGMVAIGGDDLANQLRAANKDYGMSSQVNKIAQDRIQREAANKMFGLTDTIAGAGSVGYGASTGDWTGAVGIMAAKKGFEKYGTSTLAVMADKIGKQLLKSPQMKQLATTNPNAFGAFVANMAQKLEGSGSGAVPRAAEQNESANTFQNKMDKGALLQKAQGTKYGQVLQNAANNGDQSFAAAHYVLSQRDPEYRKVTGEDEEN